MRSLLLSIVAVALTAVLGPSASRTEACGGVGQLSGYAPSACSGAYTAGYTANFVALQPPASYWMMPPAQFYSPPPQQYVQRQEVLGYTPQPVAAVNVAYATAQPVAAVNVGYTRTAAVVGFADQGHYAKTAAVVGAPVALHGRFKGNVSANYAQGQQLNVVGAVNVGKSRQRVLRPTFFRRAVGAPVVGAVTVPY